MDRISQSEIDEVIRRMRRGENLERRRKRAEGLDEYFRRRNELMRKQLSPPPSQPVPGVSGGTPASEATSLGGSRGNARHRAQRPVRPETNTTLRPSSKSAQCKPSIERRAGSVLDGRAGNQSGPVTKGGSQ